MFIRYSLLLLSLTLLPSAFGQSPGFESRANCDLPGPSIKETKTATEEDCQKLCADDAQCKASLFITGWKKCSLKSDGKKTARLKFISGELPENRVYSKGAFREDEDYTGKDLERLVLASADECGEACAKNDACKSFTYLDGYRVCWLKKTLGKYNPKVFRCSIKK